MGPPSLLRKLTSRYSHSTVSSRAELMHCVARTAHCTESGEAEGGWRASPQGGSRVLLRAPAAPSPLQPCHSPPAKPDGQPVAWGAVYRNRPPGAQSRWGGRGRASQSCSGQQRSWILTTFNTPVVRQGPRGQTGPLSNQTEGASPADVPRSPAGGNSKCEDLEEGSSESHQGQRKAKGIIKTSIQRGQAMQGLTGPWPSALVVWTESC